MGDLGGKQDRQQLDICLTASNFVCFEERAIMIIDPCLQQMSHWYLLLVFIYCTRANHTFKTVHEASEVPIVTKANKRAG